MPYWGGRPVSLDSRELRTCLGHFATGVTVVTCFDDEGGGTEASLTSGGGAEGTPTPIMVAFIDAGTRDGALPVGGVLGGTVARSSLVRLDEDGPTTTAVFGRAA